MPLCPKCGSDSKGDHARKPGEGWPNPHAIKDMGKHAQAIMRIQTQMGAQDMTDSVRAELRGRMASEKAAFKDAEKNSELPNLWCRRCDEKCCPRDPRALAYVPEHHTTC